MADFNIKVGDRLPVLAAQLLDAEGDPLDITSATSVQLRMRLETSGTPTLTAACTVTSAPDGEVEYRWAAGNTATAGTYDGEFVVTWNDGRVQTVPNSRAFKIRIAATLE